METTKRYQVYGITHAQQAGHRFDADNGFDSLSEAQAYASAALARFNDDARAWVWDTVTKAYIA